MTASENLEKLVSELNPGAKRHLKSVRWLVKERQSTKHTGRTYVLALSFIEQALENPGRRIYTFDHFPNNKENMKNSISYIFTKNPDLAKNMQLGSDWLMLSDTAPYLVK
jgi:hypothetical protein